MVVEHVPQVLGPHVEEGVWAVDEGAGGREVGARLSHVFGVAEGTEEGRTGRLVGSRCAGEGGGTRGRRHDGLAGGGMRAMWPQRPEVGSQRVGFITLGARDYDEKRVGNWG